MDDYPSQYVMGCLILLVVVFSILVIASVLGTVLGIDVWEVPY